jgi:hypothetical protein
MGWPESITHFRKDRAGEGVLNLCKVFFSNCVRGRRVRYTWKKDGVVISMGTPGVVEGLKDGIGSFTSDVGDSAQPWFVVVLCYPRVFLAAYGGRYWKGIGWVFPLLESWM